VKLLLDTHVLLWFADNHSRLRADVADAIEDEANEVLVSAVSLWEVAIKVRVGKLSADVPALTMACVRQGFRMLELSALHVSRLMALPSVEGHRDPFDHLLLAQAAAEGATFVSADPQAPRYGVPILAA
jgi:PIN domain nuclease of toxin-antitoxin system